MKLMIPKDALATDSPEGAVAPSVGDQVPIPAVMGTVTSDAGDMLEVEITSAGGQDCAKQDMDEDPAADADQAPDPAASLDKQKAGLMKAAKSADTKAGW